MPADRDQDSARPTPLFPSETVIAISLIVVAVAAVYAPLAFGQLLYRRDLSQWIYPAQWFLRSAQAHGQSISWNPFVGMGMSPYANPLNGIFYPFNWLHRFGPLAFMINIVMLAHVLGGALGMWLLARRLGVRPVVATVAASAWAFGGFTSSMWTFGIFVNACAYFPWQAWAFVRLLQSIREQQKKLIAHVAVAGLLFGMSLLLGELFLAVIGFGTAVLVAIAAQLSDQDVIDVPVTVRNRRLVVVALLATLAAGALGVLLGAATWWPARAAAHSTQRAQPLPLQVAERGSFFPARLAELGSSNITARLFETDPL